MFFFFVILVVVLEFIVMSSMNYKKNIDPSKQSEDEVNYINNDNDDDDVYNSEQLDAIEEVASDEEELEEVQLNLSQKNAVSGKNNENLASNEQFCWWNPLTWFSCCKEVKCCLNCDRESEIKRN